MGNEESKPQKLKCKCGKSVKYIIILSVPHSFGTEYSRGETITENYFKIHYPGYYSLIRNFSEKDDRDTYQCIACDNCVVGDKSDWKYSKEGFYRDKRKEQT